MASLAHSRNDAGIAEAIILIKAAPVIGKKNGETVCSAGIDIYGKWLRLYPVSFRVLEDGKRFKRWDRVKFDWRLPTNDSRIESRHVNNQTLEISGNMKSRERPAFLNKHIVTSLNKEFSEGRSLALLAPEILEFKITKKSVDKLGQQQRDIDLFHAKVTCLSPVLPFQLPHALSSLSTAIAPKMVSVKERVRTGKLKQHSSTGGMSMVKPKL